MEEYDCHWVADTEQDKGHEPSRTCSCGPELNEGVWVHKPMKGH